MPSNILRDDKGMDPGCSDIELKLPTIIHRNNLAFHGASLGDPQSHMPVSADVHAIVYCLRHLLTCANCRCQAFDAPVVPSVA